MSTNYTGNDHDQLIRSIPLMESNKCALNDVDFERLRLIEEENEKNIAQIISQLFFMINEQYKGSDGLLNLLNKMDFILNSQISNVSDFQSVFQQIVPPNQQSEDLFQKLYEFESFDMFFNRIMERDSEYYQLKDAIMKFISFIIKTMEKTI